MALLTDHYIATSADIRQIDPEAVDAAAGEQFPLTVEGDNGVCETATTMVMERLSSMMQTMSAGGVGGSGNISSHHLAAVFNTGSYGASSTPRLHPAQILTHSELVEHTWGSVKMWGVYFAIQTLYEQLSVRRLSEQDRYGQKAKRFQAKAEELFNQLMVNGVPYVIVPFPCPGAVLLPNTGRWGAANVTMQDLPGAAGGTFRVAVCWTSADYDTSKYDRGNGESAPSQTVSVTVPPDKGLVVTITGANPPAGEQLPGSNTLPNVSTVKATGWHVLVGAEKGPLYIQNVGGVPLGLEGTTYALTTDPVLSGLEARAGQTPYARMKLFHQIRRW
jgi:hypothetical protein